MLPIYNMLLITFVLFGRSQIYVTDSLPVALHVRVNGRPSIIVSFTRARVITGVSKSMVESKKAPVHIRSLSISPISFIHFVDVIDVI